VDVVGSFVEWVAVALRNEFMRQTADWVILGLACAMVAAWRFLRHRPRRPTVTAPRNFAGVIAVIVSTVALVGSVTGFVGIFGGLLGQILGIFGYWRVHRGKATNDRVPGRAIVLGFVAVAIGLMFNAVWLDFSKSPL